MRTETLDRALHHVSSYVEYIEERFARGDVDDKWLLRYLRAVRVMQLLAAALDVALEKEKERASGE